MYCQSNNLLVLLSVRVFHFKCATTSDYPPIAGILELAEHVNCLINNAFYGNYNFLSEYFVHVVWFKMLVPFKYRNYFMIQLFAIK